MDPLATEFPRIWAETRGVIAWSISRAPAPRSLIPPTRQPPQTHRKRDAVNAMSQPGGRFMSISSHEIRWENCAGNIRWEAHHPNRQLLPTVSDQPRTGKSSSTVNLLEITFYWH